MRAPIYRAAAVVLLLLSPVTVRAQSDAWDMERLVAAKQRFPVDDAAISAGKAVYLKHCAFCHGDQGAGDGGGAPNFDPRPRDFTEGLFKFRSTLSGELPTDEDLFRTISRGVPGTAMPAWGEPPFVLAEEARWQVTYYLKQLATEDFADPDFDPYEYLVELPPAPQCTPERVAAGKAVFSDEKKGGCIKCHGTAGRGDGKEAGTQRDDWGDDILPANLTKPWRYKNGDSLGEIFRTLSTGFNGTPMPGYAETLDEKERWNLACYVESLQIDATGEGQIVLVAKRRQGKLPVDPNDPFWHEPPPLDVPLAGQVIVTPRHVNAAVDAVRVRAAFNDEEIAFHFSWDDRFKNTSSREPERWMPPLERDDAFVHARELWKRRKDDFPDKLQIQFPSKQNDGAAKPFFFMGDSSKPVALWTWHADWKEDSALHGGRVAEQGNAAGYGKAPVPDESDSQSLKSRAVFENGRWRLVIVRSLTTSDVKTDVQFVAGALVPFALQAWDGGNGEEGLLCSISSWYYVLLEGRTDPRGYVWALCGMLLTLGGTTLAVRKARKLTSMLGRTET